MPVPLAVVDDHKRADPNVRRRRLPRRRWQLATVGPVSDPGARWLADAGFRARCQANLAKFRVAAAEGITPGRRRSAVALCIEAGPDGDACLVITQRAAGLRRHAGQYAL